MTHLKVMTGDSFDVARIAEEFELDSEFTWVSNVKLTGKSGAVHKFDLVVTSKKDENVKVAVLRGISEDLVSDIMKFNAIASDCGISLKALVIDKDLDDTEINLTHMYNIITIDKRQEIKSKSDVFGVKELDDSLGGAMKKGNVYMVSGKTGVGKTTTATQFLVQGARMGERGAIILTDTRGAEYIANAKTFTFGFEEYYREGTIEVIELSDRIRELKEDVLESLKNRTRYINKLTGEINRIVVESNITRLVIDPLTPMIVENDDFVNQFIMSLAIPHTYVLVTSPVMKSDVSMYGIEEYFVSGVIKLEMDDAPAGIRKASIVKMRGGSYSPYPFYFKITAKGLVSSQSDKDLKGSSVFKRVEV
jgi:circadian clock protein KaiC